MLWEPRGPQPIASRERCLSKQLDEQELFLLLEKEQPDHDLSPLRSPLSLTHRTV